jgi:hypothetical protein
MSPSTVNTGDLILFGKTVSVFLQEHMKLLHIMCGQYANFRIFNVVYIYIYIYTYIHT